MHDTETIYGKPIITEPQGFSLIEFVIVSVILAVFSCVATPKFIGIPSCVELIILKQLKASMVTAGEQINLHAQMAPGSA